MLKASIIIVNFNSGEHLGRCLRSIIDNTPAGSFDIHVIDNHSQDDSLECLGQHSFSQVRLMRNAANLGYAKACNQGMKISSGDPVVTMNPDVEVGLDWLNRLAYHLEPQKVMMVGPMSLGIGGKQWAGPLRFPANLNAANRWFYRRYRHTSRPAKFIIGCLAAIKRRALDTVGYLDESLPLGADDFDLSLRLRKAGFELRIAGDVLVRHICHVSFLHPDRYTEAMADESWRNFRIKWAEELKRFGWADLFENERPVWYRPGDYEAKGNRDENHRNGYAPSRRGLGANSTRPRAERPLVTGPLVQRGSVRFSARHYSTHGPDPLVGRLRRSSSPQ